MPLDDREQRILEEIERHLYEEDPRLAHTVAKASFGKKERMRQRIAAVVFIVGLIVMFGSFTTWPIVAGLGFVAMVASAGSIAMSIRAGRTDTSENAGIEGWLDRLRERWRRDG